MQDCKDQYLWQSLILQKNRYLKASIFHTMFFPRNGYIKQFLIFNLWSLKENEHKNIEFKS